MRIGILGGSFDPVHLGHLLAAKAALEELKLDEIWLVPCYRNPFKGKDRPLAPAEDRLKMLELAVEGNPKLKVSRLELERKIVFSADSIKALKERFPEHEFYWIVGSCLVEEVPKWKKAEEFLQAVTLVVIAMPGFAKLESAIAGFNPLVIMPEKRSSVSSTLVRERLVKGKSVEGLVPEKVRHYIEKKKLYQA